jgi:hypothetical protein
VKRRRKLTGHVFCKRNKEFVSVQEALRTYAIVRIATVFGDMPL